MMSDSEMNAFLAHVEELSQESSSAESFSQIQKLTKENAKLKTTLNRIRVSTKEVLDIYKNERNLKEQAQRELENVKGELNELRQCFEELQNKNVNIEFSCREKIDSLELKHNTELKNYIELSKDYLEVLSTTSIYYNFEVQKERNRIVVKTEKFLAEKLGEKFKKPKIISKRGQKPAAEDDKKCVAEKRTRSSKVKQEKVERKRRKIEIFDMQSISQVASPACIDEEEENNLSDNETSFSFNTFSIGNETSFTLIDKERRRKSQESCKCHEEAIHLVSIGVNTEDPTPAVLPSLPNLHDEDFDFSFSENDVVNSTLEDNLKPCDEHPSSSDESSGCLNKETQNVKTQVSVGVNTVCQTVDSSTSPERQFTADKSTFTIRSTTTRGTSTPAPQTKSIGLQYPEMSMDYVFDQINSINLFNLPQCLSPLSDLSEELPTTVEHETQTDISNVNRLIDYCEKRNTAEEEDFIILGKTLYNLFIKKLRESNKSLNEEHFRDRLINQINDLTFDEYFNPTLSDHLPIFDAAEECILNDRRDHEEKKYKRVFSEILLNEKEIVCDVHSQVDSTEITESTSDNVNECISDNLSNEGDLCEKEISCSEKIINVSNSDETICVELQKDISEDVSSIMSAENKDPASQTNDTMIENHNPVVEDQHPGQANDALEENFADFLKNLGAYFDSLLPLDPILDLDDVMWSSLFPDKEEPDPDITEENVLDGFDFEFDPIEIPVAQLNQEDVDGPESPPLFSLPSESPYEPQSIPLDRKLCANVVTDGILKYDPNIRQKLVHWKERHTIMSKTNEKRLCKVRKLLKNYLESEWTDENLQTCVDSLSSTHEVVLVEAIFECVEDNDWNDEINTEFTPPAPPLPRYQQKLILLIHRLTEFYPKLPQNLIENLEQKIFKCENSIAELKYLKNVTYYYTALADLYLNGDPAVIFHFVVKCIYFYGCNAVPMIFVLLKAFPLALPKKSLLLKKYSTNIDWENMTGLELTKVRLDIEWFDSLDLTVMYLITNIQTYRSKGKENAEIYNHELFNYVPKYYGFPLSFITAPKLLDVLINRFEAGELKNLSFSFILLGRRMNVGFVTRTMLKEKLIPLLNKVADGGDNEKICVLIEAVSTMLKPLNQEIKIFNEVFPIIVNTLSRTGCRKVKEFCIKAILRLQRFITNSKDIYEILKKHLENEMAFSDGLRNAVVTFIHRKNEVYFKN